MNLETKDDLSGYERLRLENIKRNQDFLSSLGLAAIKSQQVISASRSASSSDPPKRKKLRGEEVRPESTAKRRSARLSDYKDIAQVEISETESSSPRSINTLYSNMPQEADEIDDFEFQCFVIVKKWRLQLCRSLGIDEPYKIMKNRTICEFIRRKRNDVGYATGSAVVADLLSCWGIGPTKAHTPEGFGQQLRVFFDEGADSGELAALLAKSRSLQGDVVENSERHNTD